MHRSDARVVIGLLLTVAALRLPAATITLPKITVSGGLTHSFLTESPNFLASQDEMDVQGAAASSLAGGFSGSYGPGDLINIELDAPAGSTFVYKRPPLANSLSYVITEIDYGYFQYQPQSVTLTIGGLSGPAPDGVRYAGVAGSGFGVYSSLDPASFSFTSLTYSFTVPAGVSGSGSFTLSQVILLSDVFLPFSASDPGPNLTVQPQPIPEPTSIVALAAFGGLIAFRRR